MTQQKPEKMTRQRAAVIIEERIRIDREGILEGGEPASDFDKFIVEQDEALELALSALKNPVGFLGPSELLEAYWKQQNIYDIEDMENELDGNSEWYAEKFGTDKAPVTKEELEQMAGVLRKLLDDDADATWSSCRERAADEILKKRKEKSNV